MQLDRVGLGHNTFTAEALALIVRSGEGLLRNLAGNAIDFHVQVLGLSFHDAMRHITAT